jgi:hypothetical protein
VEGYRAVVAAQQVTAFETQLTVVLVVIVNPCSLLVMVWVCVMMGYKGREGRGGEGDSKGKRVSQYSTD